MLILAFFCYGLNDVYQQKNNIVKKTLYKDQFKDISKIRLDQGNFDVGVSLGISGDAEYDANLHPERYFNIQWLNAMIGYDELGTMTIQSRYIDSVKCSRERFGGDPEVIEKCLLNLINAPKPLDVDVYGSQTGASSQFTLFITPCDNQTLIDNNQSFTCATVDEIKKAFSLSLVYVLVQTSYFDAFELSKNPIKQQFTTLVYSISYDLGNGQDIYIQENQVITQDSWFGAMFGNQEYKYNDIARGSVYLGAVKPDLMPQLGLYFMISPYQDIVTRTVKSFMDCLSMTGGLSSIIALIGKVLIAKLQQQFMLESLINKLFKVIKEKEDSKQTNGKKLSINFSNLKPKEKVDDSQYSSLRFFTDQKGQKKMLKSKTFTRLCQNENQKFCVWMQKKLQKYSQKQTKILTKILLTDKQQKLLAYTKDNIISTSQICEEQSISQIINGSTIEAKQKVNSKAQIRKMKLSSYNLFQALDPQQFKQMIFELNRDSKKKKVEQRLLKELLLDDFEDNRNHLQSINNSIPECLDLFQNPFMSGIDNTFTNNNQGTDNQLPPNSAQFNLSSQEVSKRQHRHSQKVTSSRKITNKDFQMAFNENDQSVRKYSAHVFTQENNLICNKQTLNQSTLKTQANDEYQKSNVTIKNSNQLKKDEDLVFDLQGRPDLNKRSTKDSSPFGKGRVQQIFNHELNVYSVKRKDKQKQYKQVKAESFRSSSDASVKGTLNKRIDSQN
eukprot:403367250